MNLRECYDTIGADYDDVMRRLLSEARVSRFLAMFLRDGSYHLLCDSMEAGDCEEAFRAVHTIKGICINLGLIRLQERCVALTENLRDRQPDGETVQLFNQVKEEYLLTAEAIRAYL